MRRLVGSGLTRSSRRSVQVEWAKCIARETFVSGAELTKVFPRSVRSDPDRRARFEREARAAAALSHPTYPGDRHDYDTHGGVPYAVMELLHGETLRSPAC